MKIIHHCIIVIVNNSGLCVRIY